MRIHGTKFSGLCSSQDLEQLTSHTGISNVTLEKNMAEVKWLTKFKWRAAKARSLVTCWWDWSSKNAVENFLKNSEEYGTRSLNGRRKKISSALSRKIWRVVRLGTRRSSNHINALMHLKNNKTSSLKRKALKSVKSSKFTSHATTQTVRLNFAQQGTSGWKLCSWWEKYYPGCSRWLPKLLAR